MEHKIYVHIGSNKFDKNLFKPIKNIDFFVKPSGGLWGSPIDSPYGWEDWVKANNFNHTIGFDKYGNDRFYFQLKPNVRLLTIDNVKILNDLPQISNPVLQTVKSFVSLDYEALAQEYDAIEVNISADENLYWELYGWDVDSILVLNSNCISIVDNMVGGI